MRSEGDNQTGGECSASGGDGLLVRGVESRRWAPTVLLGVAVLLTLLAVVVARPLTAGAASSAPIAVPKHRAATLHAQKISKVTPGVATSPNWSGYVAYASMQNDGSFNLVSAEWTEPAVTCPKKNAWTLFWVGFDGWPANEPTMDRSVEQGGTSAQCVAGVPHYSAFWEMWPTDAVQTMFSIDAGDQIMSSVIYSPSSNEFLITVSDSRNGHVVNSQTVNEPCGPNLACPRMSAEWVAESPAHFGTDTWFPLANYGTMNFTSATATNEEGDQGPISYPTQWSDSGIERVAGAAKPLATVYGLENSGTTSSFYDAWTRR
jgi:Peptidase A4 family